MWLATVRRNIFHKQQFLLIYWIDHVCENTGHKIFCLHTLVYIDGGQYKILVYQRKILFQGYYDALKHNRAKWR